MKKILIIGGGGYVGSALADYLCKKVMKFQYMTYSFMVRMYLIPKTN